MEYGDFQARKKLTIILLLLGRYERQTAQFDKKLKELCEIQDEIDIVIACDSLGWNTVPEFQVFQLEHPRIQVVFCESPALPAQILNAAMRVVNSDYLFISLLEDPLLSRLELFWDALSEGAKKTNILKHQEMFKSQEIHEAYYICPARNPSGRDIFLPSPENLYGWAMASESSFCFGSFCIPVAWVQAAGGFDESPLLLEEIERWYALLVTQSGSISPIASEEQYVKRLREYPLERKGRQIQRDLAVRYATYSRGIAAEMRSSEICHNNFAHDLNDTEAAYYQRITGIKRTKNTPYKTRYKILILGGIWEYHHAQICFFNYFERVYGQGYATFRFLLEYNTLASQALDYDLVIFVRCHSKNALQIMRQCEHYHVPTLYMIDDNWLSIAEDHPDVGKMFVLGNEDYDHFLDALGLCKATWLFNDLIKEDVLPYTKCVQKFKISVDPKLFHCEKPRKHNDQLLYVGFSGSLRYNDTAFRALARYARRHKNIVVILIGVLSKEQEAIFRNIKTIRIPFSSYKIYAQEIARLQPDLLIAPLENTHTMQSKCYNKYVESGIVGSACLYSKLRPYTDVVKDGVNGFFVEDESAEGWYKKLDEILGDIPKLREVQKNAKSDIERNHTVDSILHEFCSKICAIIEEETIEDD